jgi:hypothetical protein
VFDRLSQIKSLLNYGIMFDDVKDISVPCVLDKVSKYVKNGKADLIFAHTQLITAPAPLAVLGSQRDLREEMNKNLELLNEKLAEIYHNAAEDTSNLY